MYPHPHSGPPLDDSLHLPDVSHHYASTYPVVVDPPDFNLRVHGNYYQSYPDSLPCAEASDYQPYPPQLHIQTDLAPPTYQIAHDQLQSAGSTSYPATITPPSSSAGPPSSAEDYPYDNPHSSTQEYDSPGQYHIPSRLPQQPYRDAPHSQWQNPDDTYAHSYSSGGQASSGVANPSQWDPSYNDEHHPQYHSHPSYYHDPHGDPSTTSDGPYSPEYRSQESHQYGGPTEQQGVYVAHPGGDFHAHENSSRGEDHAHPHSEEDNLYASHGHDATYPVDPANSMNYVRTDPSSSHPHGHAEPHIESASSHVHTRAEPFSSSSPHDGSYLGRGATRGPGRGTHEPRHDRPFVPEPESPYVYERQQRIEERTSPVQPSPSTWQAHTPPAYLPYAQESVERQPAPMASLQAPSTPRSPARQAQYASAPAPTQVQAQAQNPPATQFHPTEDDARLIEPIPRLSQRSVGSSSLSPTTAPHLSPPQPRPRSRQDSRPEPAPAPPPVPAPAPVPAAEEEEELPQAPIVPSQQHLAQRRERQQQHGSGCGQPFRPFHPYPAHHRTSEFNQLTPRIHYHDGLAGGCMPPPVFGLFGSYPLSRGPRELPLPGPTCAPASSSSVMRLVLTPPFKRPAPPPPPVVTPQTPATKRPRMACYFCRKRKIACGPGPAAVRTSHGGKDMTYEDDGPCNQCARRGLECERPTESKRGVRKGKGKDKDGEDGRAASGSNVTLELAPRPRPSAAIPEDDNGDDGGGDDSDDDDEDDDDYVDDGLDDPGHG